MQVYKTLMGRFTSWPIRMIFCITVIYIGQQIIKKLNL